MTGTLYENHVREINRCNQRGGRMLSLADLVDARSADLPMAAWLAAVMRSGASLLVGARPGGAGKTAVMCALLNFLPDNVRLVPVDRWPLPEAGRTEAPPGGTCFVAHEIGPGPYYAYVWGEAARGFLRLTERGHLIASNLHADTLEEARAQLCATNAVPPADWQRIHLKVFLRTSESGGGVQRWISSVYENTGKQDRLIWEKSNPKTPSRRLAPGTLVTPAQEKQAQEILASLCVQNIRTIEDIRRCLIDDKKER